MKKAGRPVEENSMKKIVTLRMTDAEYAALFTYAKKSSKTLTQVVKEGIQLIMREKPLP